jgi:deoxyribodipyrimidine photolyase-related protein
MSTFRSALAAHRTREAGRRWLFVPYDQLTDAVGPLAREAPHELGIIVVECPGKAARRPYHKQKLALVLASLRHFALEQAARGVAVRHVVAPSYLEALEALLGRPPFTEPVRVMRPAERELRAELAPLFESGKLVAVEHEGWLTTTEDFRLATDGRAWRMDAFYRQVRRRLDLLMRAGKPEGGRFSFDPENRKAWRGEPPEPALPTFAVDEITAEVCALVRTTMADHPGTLRAETIAATRDDVDRAWRWARSECLEHFGPFEDAMSLRARNLFHTRLSPLLNLQRLPARRVVDDTLAMELPLPSKEGFLRQILGWREYVRHVHEATDGFRVLHGRAQPCADTPDRGSLTSVLGSNGALPEAYWGKASGLRCLDEVVASVWDEGYSHHITRLMVLSNIATLLDVSPRALTDWFWAAYIDAYDWVVEPNVHAMGTFGVGDLMTTKPYIAGSAYIDKMSDYCGDCRFDPKKNCPLTPLYWAFLGRHRDVLAGVDRMKLPVLAESRRSEEQKQSDARTYERVRATLAHGEPLTVPKTKAL